MIGSFLVRVSKSGAAVTLGHLVESVIADRVVTHCGRQMATRNRDGTLRFMGPADERCSRCIPEASAQAQYGGAFVSQARRDDLLDDAKVWPV